MVFSHVLTHLFTYHHLHFHSGVEFYDTALDSIEKVLSLASADDISAAQKLVDATSLPPFLFKQFAEGQTFRPPTP
jgi:hypothetical protein